MRNTVPMIEKNIEIAKIRGTLIKLINELTPLDIGAEIEEKEIVDIEEESQIEEKNSI